eukprot:24164-Amphidinium_carterae.1
MHLTSLRALSEVATVTSSEARLLVPLASPRREQTYKTSSCWEPTVLWPETIRQHGIALRTILYVILTHSGTRHNCRMSHMGLNKTTKRTGLGVFRGWGEAEQSPARIAINVSLLNRSEQNNEMSDSHVDTMHNEIVKQLFVDNALQR